MLGKIVNLLATIPDRIGVILDLTEKLASNAGAEWYENLRKFLRKEPCWVTSTAQVAVEIARTLIIDSSKGFTTMIAECGNNWVNDDITEKRFPITSEDDGEWEYDLWDPKDSVSSLNAVERMKGDDKENPWLPARTAHLLAFGKINPDAQRKNPIVALGSVARVGGSRGVLCLGKDCSGRNLHLFWWDGGWGDRCRFLRVRKVKKS